jgi:hypothetical protein
VLRAGGGAFFDTANESATLGYGGVGFYQTQLTAGSPLPAVPSQLTFTPSAAPPYTNKTVYAFPAHLQLPYTLQWNVSLQQALREAQSLTISYVASSGRRLVGWEELNLKSFNPNFGPVITFPSNLTSNYQGLQVQFQRSVSQGLQALVSYTWSHSLDFGSNYEALPLTRGNSDFDVRHNLSGGVTWTLPTPATSSVLNAIAANWGIDGRLVAHTSFPVTLSGNLVTDPTNGSEYYGGMNLLAGKPIYLYGAQCPALAQSRCPGGRLVNSAAFQAAPSGEVGDAPRNFVRGFGDAQVNFAVRRDFPIHENTRLQFRAESFNLLNHPNFGYVDPYLTDATFGQATKMLNQSLGTVASQYQQGGPRSMQLALRFLF